MAKLTQKRLKEVLDYDPETGIFIWKTRASNRINVGDVAGVLDEGYIRITVDGDRFFAHRLAWIYAYGYFPENDIDHKDRVKHHNWISNLREASNQCNARNTGNHITNTSGVKGVHHYKERDNWSVYIIVNGSQKFLGYYKEYINAVCARLAAEQCLGWEGCDSSSPAFKCVMKHILGVSS